MKISEPSLTLQVKKEKEGVASGWMLAAKVMSTKVLGLHKIRENMNADWKLKGSFALARFNEKCFSISLQLKDDYDRILEERPWNIANQHINIKEWQGDIPMDNIDFTSSLFWVQVKGLPPNQVNEENARRIATLFNRFVELDMDHRAPLWRHYFLRIRIELDNSSPLLAGFHNTTDATKREWIRFRFEKLPDICFFCGKMGHTRSFCETRITEEEAGIFYAGKYRYGLFMRANPPRRAREMIATLDSLTSIQPTVQTNASANATNVDASNGGLGSINSQEIREQISFQNTYEYDIEEQLARTENVNVNPGVHSFQEVINSEFINTGLMDLNQFSMPVLSTPMATNRAINEYNYDMNFPGSYTPQYENNTVQRVPRAILQSVSQETREKYTKLEQQNQQAMEQQVAMIVEFFYGKHNKDKHSQIVSDKDMEEIRALLADINPSYGLPTSIADFQSAKEQTCVTQIEKAVKARTWKKQPRKNAKTTKAGPDLNKVPATRGRGKGKRKLSNTEFEKESESPAAQLARTQGPQTIFNMNEMVNTNLIIQGADIGKGQDPQQNQEAEARIKGTKNQVAEGDEASLKEPQGPK
ncbi:uncharacterized protein LOC126671095 [Mercurialis annua]|uniref:uncharacterized protein LOC126671095 n=1 Tax=Mercurialis annua TaxID=3986 RepID=UPI00215FBE68|nr:uncharacterized protein LOC126671095 [Mercurialis annua]